MPVRLVLLVFAMVGVLAFLGIRAVRRYQASRLDELTLAMTLDRHRPGTGQQIADVLQLPELLDRTGASCLASDGATGRAACAAPRWPARTGARSGTASARHSPQSALILGLLVPLAFAAIAPRAARLSVARWLLGSSQRWPQRTYLTVMGLNKSGSLLAPRDERFPVEVRADLPLVEPRGSEWIVHGRGEPTMLWSKPAQPTVPASGAHQGANRGRQGQERRDVRGGAATVHVRAAAGVELVGDRLDRRRRLARAAAPSIRVDRPSLAETRIRVKEPGATYTGFRTVDDPRQHLLFLPDTEIELTLVGTEPISESQVKIQAGKTLPLARADERTFTTSWKLTEATTLEILLTSAKTALASKPTFLSIGLLKDRAPRVTLRALGTSGHVTPIATIPLSISATDDFGLAAPAACKIDRTTSSDDKVRAGHEAAEPGPAAAAREGPPDCWITRCATKSCCRQTRPRSARSSGSWRRPTTAAPTARRRAARAPSDSGRLAGRAFLRDLDPPAGRAGQVPGRARSRREADSGAGRPAEGGRLPERDAGSSHRHRGSSTRSPARVADTLQEMKLNQVGSPKSHRLLQQAIIDPIRALDGRADEPGARACCKHFPGRPRPRRAASPKPGDCMRKLLQA